jgi:hypothetical protein
METLNKLVKEEGLRTFTKGLGPRMINNGNNFLKKEYKYLIKFVQACKAC